MTFRDDFLTPNVYSRPGDPMQAVVAVVVHYTANPGQTAAGLRTYFESLKWGIKPIRQASSHYAVDWTETIYMVPRSEVAWHGGNGQPWPTGYTDFAKAFFPGYPNYHSIGIETCHKDDSGRFEPETLDNLRGLCALLCTDSDLNPMSAIIRHYDIVGRKADGVLCPRWFVEHEDEWTQFRDSVKETMINLRERGGVA